MTDFSPSPLDQTAINTLRFLAVDMVEKANSGHPGAPMGQAPMAYLLWSRHLGFDPTHPEWPNRDRFVLSCGHASALIYGLLHLSGYELGLDEIRNFRQLGSKTPGHPEHGHTPGVETTTGPLGQGVANAVGMAIAERLLAQRFNRDGFNLFDHRTWAIASDGDMMEGVASEASSLAGHLRLGRLNVLYDANQITIDGSTNLSFTEHVTARYAAYGWHTQVVEDGNNLESLDAAMRAAILNDRPSLIEVRTHIGYGSPNKQDSAASHGAALGEEEVRLTKLALDWPLEPTFLVPEEATAAFEDARRRGREARSDWLELEARYSNEYTSEAADLERRRESGLPASLDDLLPRFQPSDGPLATRKASGATLQAIQNEVPELTGGSADLTGSNNTLLANEADFAAGAPARHLRWGVREHGMGAIANGMALSGLVRPYCGTFLIFSDYMRPSIRLAALMGLPVTYVLTHDSIFLGEDGPTHQPISQLAALRAIPGLLVLRPADANETVAAWRVALEHRDGPTALILTRQKLPILEQTAVASQPGSEGGVERGAYTLSDSEQPARVLLIATGSEVSLALEAQRALDSKGVPARVVSMPSWELFEQQSEEYRAQVLPPETTARLAIEAASPMGWDRYVGPGGAVLGVERFGASAPLADLQQEYGFTVAEVERRVGSLLAR